jgi:hypothetical protein
MNNTSPTKKIIFVEVFQDVSEVYWLLAVLGPLN